VKKIMAEEPSKLEFYHPKYNSNTKDLMLHGVSTGHMFPKVYFIWESTLVLLLCVQARAAFEPNQPSKKTLGGDKRGKS